MTLLSFQWSQASKNAQTECNNAVCAEDEGEGSVHKNLFQVSSISSFHRK